MKMRLVLPTSTTVLVVGTVLLASPLVFLACGGGGSSPTEPAAPVAANSAASPEASGVSGGGIGGEIDIEKSTNGEDADKRPGPSLVVGDPVEWRYVVSNTGKAPVSGIRVTDDKLGAVVCPAASLGAGESMTCAASGVAVAGRYQNIGTVEGTLSDGSTVSDSDPSHYLGVTLKGDIRIEKSTNGEDADQGPGPSVLADDPVDWRYVVTNTGDLRLTDIRVTDDKLGAVVCPKAALTAGESMTCAASGSAVPGPYRNVGTVEGTLSDGSTVSDSDPSHYNGVSQDGAIDIEKSTNGQDADVGPGPTIGAGDPVRWNYVVTNTGNVELTGIRVTDDRIGAVVCPRASLGAGASMTCAASGTAVAGPYRNLGTVVGRMPNGSTVSDSDPSHYNGRSDDSGGDKVAICHIPPGNPANRKVIEVGASAVNAHLGHGDNLFHEVEICGDGLDNNCEGRVDEGCG